VITVYWLLAAVLSAVAMMAASRVAIHHTIALAEGLHAPPFFVGITVVAVGTDVPELFNSVAASYLGPGDINVGDSIGSVFTQGALVGVLPFFAASVLHAERRDVVLIPGLTIAALAIGVVLMADGNLARLDAAILVLTWAALTGIAWRYGAVPPETSTRKPAPGALVHLARTLLALGIVGVAAAVLVLAIASVSASLGLPEYVLSFFGVSFGTSMPEIAVELTAVRRGRQDIAIGDALGSCLVDASLSVAAGPLLFPTAVTTSLVVRGAILAIAAMVLVAVLVGVRRRLDRGSGAVLLAAYVAAYFFLLAPA
jgi:cation:H+ antiporter